MLAYPYVHPPWRTQVSRRNGAFILMIPFAPLLATAIACADAEDLINGVQRNRDITSDDKKSLVEVIKANAEGCFKDAND